MPKSWQTPLPEKRFPVLRGPIPRQMRGITPFMSFVIRTIPRLCCSFEAKIGYGCHSLFGAQKIAGLTSCQTDVRN
jgi:hypothetical protein